LTFEDLTTMKWQVGKQTDNSFIVYDAVNGRTDVQIISGGDLSLMGGGGNIYLGQYGGQGSITSYGGIAVTPTNAAGGSPTMGLAITQTGPNNGTSVTNTQNYNSINVTDGVHDTQNGAFTNAFDVNMNLASNEYGQKAAITASMNRSQTAANPFDMIGIISYMSATANDGGTSGTAKGTMYAINPIVSLQAGATYYQIVSGMEIDMGVNTGASTQLRYGMDLVSVGNNNGSVQDAAIAIASASAPWQNALYLTQGNGSWGQPLATGGCVICTDGGTLSIATLIDVGTYTITSNVLNTKPLQIDSNGTIYFKRGGSAGLVPSISGHNGVSVAVGASMGVSANGSLLTLYRDSTSGGTALVACEAGYGPTIVWQSATNFTTTDPGVGGNKWFIQNAAGHYCDALNRYTSAHNISYSFITTDGAAAP